MIDEPRRPELHQEEDRLPASVILLVFTSIGLVGIFLVVWAWYGLEKRELELRPSGAFPERELGPRRTVSEELANVFGEMGPGQMLNEQKKRKLASFEWIDRQRRIVAIPIDDAINLLLAGSEP